MKALTKINLVQTKYNLRNISLRAVSNWDCTRSLRNTRIVIQTYLLTIYKQFVKRVVIKIAELNCEIVLLLTRRTLALSNSVVEY